MEMADPVVMYDFAILTMNSSIRFSSTIVPACLPNNPEEDYAWSRAQTSGWGLLHNEDSTKRQKADKLMSVRLTVLPISVCKNASIHESGRPPKFVNQSYMLCVGSAEPLPFQAAKGIYEGDSGGTYLYYKVRFRAFCFLI